MTNLRDTARLMDSSDYRERFVAEYWQTKIRYEKLKALNTKIEAVREVELYSREPQIERPKHDCPDGMLRGQQRIMGEYLHCLEVRAVIEGIDLNMCERYRAEDTADSALWEPIYKF